MLDATALVVAFFLYVLFFYVILSATCPFV